MSMNNPIGKLQELHQQDLSHGPPLYDLIERTGEDHGPTFRIKATYRGLSAIGEGSSKKQAKTVSASKLLSLIDSSTDPNMIPTVKTPSFTGNMVGELQEFCSVKGLNSPWYEEQGAIGPDHMRMFTMLCVLGDIKTKGEGTTKKIAKREAAQSLLEKLKEMNDEELRAYENPEVKKRHQEFEKQMKIEEEKKKEDDEKNDGPTAEESGEPFVSHWTGHEVEECPEAFEEQQQPTPPTSDKFEL